MNTLRSRICLISPENPASFSEEKPEDQGLFKSYARDQAGGKIMG